MEQGHVFAGATAPGIVQPFALGDFAEAAQPLPAYTLLPAEEGAVLSKPGVRVLKSEELEERCARHSMPEPYWDPELRRPQKHCDFLRRLAAAVLLCGTDKVEAEVEFVCVKNKEDQQRLVVVCRDANHLMRLPPKTRLGSAATIAEIEVPDSVFQSPARGSDPDDLDVVHQAID